MKKFIAIYNAPITVQQNQKNATPEELEKGMQAWFAWKDKCGEHIVDFGAPLSPGQNIKRGNAWSEQTSDTSGYSIVQAETKDQAQDLFIDHPHLFWGEGCTIDLHEFVQM